MSETEERPVSDNTANKARERDRERKKRRQLREERRGPRGSLSIKEREKGERKKERVEGRKGERNQLSRERTLLSLSLACTQGGRGALEGRGALQEARRNWSHSAGQETARMAETEERRDKRGSRG